MKKNVLIFVLLIIITGLVIWYLDYINSSVPNSQVSYNYVTDTVYIDTTYTIPVSEGLITKPITLIKYRIDSIALDSLNLIINQQNIIIAGLKDSIAISSYYLKQFPRNPKLLSFSLIKDTLRIGLLPISGQIEERVWPIDLNSWGYIWDFNSDLTRHPTESSTTLDKPFAEYFVGGGVDILWLSPYLSGRIEKDFRRVRLYGDAHIGLLKKETHGLKIGLEYRLNGESINRKR